MEIVLYFLQERQKKSDALIWKLATGGILALILSSLI